MVNLTTCELRLIAGLRGIKNYKNMSREKLISTLDELERNFKNISQDGLEHIAKMQNLSQNELAQITKMWNLSQNELEQIAKMRRIKNYSNSNMSKEELLIALQKSVPSHAELQKSKSNNVEIEKANFFNELKNKFSKEEIKEIREKFDKYFEELGREYILKNEEKKVKKYCKYKKRINKILKN